MNDTLHRKNELSEPKDSYDYRGRCKLLKDNYKLFDKYGWKASIYDNHMLKMLFPLLTGFLLTSVSIPTVTITK